MMTYNDFLENMCEDCIDYPCYALRHNDKCYPYLMLKECIEKYEAVIRESDTDGI